MVDVPGGANDHMFDVFHGENAICPMMLAKAATAGQMTEYKNAIGPATANHVRNYSAFS
jgi:hypothetical protein